MITMDQIEAWISEARAGDEAALRRLLIVRNIIQSTLLARRVRAARLKWLGVRA